MISYKDIRDVHLEIATLCNASCPWCPRTFWGYPYNGGYPELYLTLEHAQKIFSNEFLQQLTSIRINGNYGDIVMNPNGADIVEYFVNANPNLKITINTNGAARDKDFWSRLGKLGVTVTFALDGLEDTHSLYRQNTVWSQVIKNAQTYIAEGGQAVWQMIKFNHNRRQVAECRDLSKQLGFARFVLIDDGRNTAPVFNHRGELVHVLGDYQGEREFPVLFYSKQHDEVLLEDIVPGRTPSKKIQCETKQLKSIYIAANGDVSPCCYTGFYPHTYGHGQYHQAANAQLVPMINNNNALKYSIEECIEWFSNVEQSWNVPTFEQGRLVICNDNCGKN
jgi:MoaA/NifB/PqqE/SkfB family radical SAM enzyme